MSYHRISAH